MFHLYRSKDKQWYFTVRARNGRVLVTSETYQRKGFAVHAMSVLSETLVKAYIDSKTPVFHDHTKPKTKQLRIFRIIQNSRENTSHT